MLEYINAINPMGDVVTLPIGETLNGFYVSDVQGLDPSNADLVYSDYAGIDGSKFESSRKKSRDISISIEYDPDFIETTPETSRKFLWKHFMTGSNVTLHFVFSGGETKVIEGQVETFSGDRFTDAPRAKINIVCPRVYFYSLEPVTFSGTSVSNNSTTNVEYKGNAPTGFLLEIDVPKGRQINLIQVTTEHSDEKYQLEFVTKLTDADVVRINTVPGNKTVIVNRLGIDLPMLGYVSPTSRWPLLFPGSNKFRVNISGAAVPYTVTYLERDDAI